MAVDSSAQPPRNLTGANDPSLSLGPSHQAGVGRRQLRFAWAAIATLVIIGSVATRFADTPLLVIPGFLAMFETALFVINLMLAVLLFIKGNIQERGDTIRLGTAYLFVALIIIPQLASFPGGFMPVPLIGSAETPLWIWSFWHLGFGLAIVRYAWFAGRPTPTSSSVPRSVTLAIVSAMVVSVVAVNCSAILPAVMLNGHFRSTTSTLLIGAAPPLVATVAALIVVVRLRGTSPERLWLVVGLVASCMEVWLVQSGTARYTVGWYVSKVASLATSAGVLIALLHEITSLYSKSERANDILHGLAWSDGLTGIGNRRAFDERLDDAFRTARRQHLPLALIMLDIDFFKGFNDAYGHLAGDSCLRQVSAEVALVLRRPGDTVARYGGEEIAVLLPATGVDGAVVIAERVRAAIKQLAIPHSGSGFGVVTVSAGVASLLPLDGADQPSNLVSAADQALYLAKKGGRNRVGGGPAADGPARSYPATVA